MGFWSRKKRAEPIITTQENLIPGIIPTKQDIRERGFERKRRHRKTREIHPTEGEYIPLPKAPNTWEEKEARAPIFPDQEVTFNLGIYVDVFGNKIVNTQKKVLILLINPELWEQRGSLFYAGVIWQKYSDKKIQIIGVGYRKSNPEYLKYLASEYNLKFPLIHDGSGKIFKKFQARPCCGAIILLENGKIKHLLHSINQQDHIRQVVERELFGKVNRQILPVRLDIFKLGQKIHWLKISTIDTFEKFRIQKIIKGDCLINFFSSMCAICETGKRLKTLGNLKEKYPNLQIITILLQPFESRDIEFFKQAGLNFLEETYLAHNFFSLEEQYLTNDYIKKDPYAIMVNKEGEVIMIEGESISEKEFIVQLEKTWKERIH